MVKENVTEMHKIEIRNTTILSFMGWYDLVTSFINVDDESLRL